MSDEVTLVEQAEGGASIRQHVLVADDDPIAREIARDTLEEAGFIVSLAENGLQVLAQIAVEMPDLILLDVEMPELDGFSTCARLRALPQGESVPVIIVTGSDDIEAAERALEVKATDFVNKPVKWPILVQRIRHILHAARTFMELKRSQQRLLSAQQMANLGYWDLDLATGLLQVSAQGCHIIGFPQGNVHSLRDYIEVVHEEDREIFKAKVSTGFVKGEPWLDEHRIVTASGETEVIKVMTEMFFSAVDETKSIGAMGIVQDITEQRRSEEIIRRMAFYDDVTGLHNRVAFMEELKLVLNLHKRMETVLAVLYLDLDDFKRVNDSLGHHLGDRLLKKFADRLTEALRASDLAARDRSSVLARLGGDEFVLLLTGLKHKTDAATVARRIQSSLAQPFVLDMETEQGLSSSHELYVSASIGIAVYPTDGMDAETLLKNADKAMYAAKHMGKNTHRFYVDDMNDRALERLDMETRLRGALDRNEFCLHYQPQFDLNTGEIAGVEALLRWNNPDLGSVSPTEFIPLAEETGQIIAIGAWVLKTACDQIKQWQDAGLSNLKVAVNLSSLQFRQGKLGELVTSALQKSGVDAKLLELELTESMIMRDVEQSIATLNALKLMGVKISIDDFGTGHSSLSYLQRFPIDILKIDQSFIRGLGVDAGNTAIVNAIIAMGKSLGFMIVAEGVEEQAQLQFLQEKDCDIAQGFLLSHPLPADQIPVFLGEPNKKLISLIKPQQSNSGDPSAAVGKPETGGVKNENAVEVLRSQALSGRVLLAEDNPINQEVAQEMLEQLGLQVDVVSDGREAYSAVCQTRYDLVLMDIHMPGVDGMEATEMIREMEEGKSEGHRTPILALTANAMVGDRERFLAGGMDDYLSKPFSQQGLATLLSRWLIPNLSAGSTSQPSANIEADDFSREASPALDPADWARLKKVYSGSRAGKLVKLVDMFLDSTEKLQVRLHQAVDEGDGPGLWKAAHALKSSSGNMAALTLAKYCAELEKTGRSGQLDGAGAQLVELRAEFARVAAELRAAVVA
ncbi:MAG: EAL domain-containing protein [Porticoccaceae bacterium]|nr:EAL domain-containing protein [Porticoccaceae bacterium]